MPAYKDQQKGTWYVSFYYQDWTGKRQKKLKRGFPTKRESPPVVFSAASAGETRPIRKKSGGIRFLREKNAVLLA